MATQTYEGTRFYWPPGRKGPDTTTRLSDYATPVEVLRRVGDRRWDMRQKLRKAHQQGLLRPVVAVAL